MYSVGCGLADPERNGSGADDGRFIDAWVEWDNAAATRLISDLIWNRKFKMDMGRAVSARPPEKTSVV